ncbi:MAG: ArsA family ATPase [Candidatus Njordarchaeales archaeon]
MLFEYLTKRKWILLSGKGGTGKTTMAAAFGVKLASMGKKVIVVSLDPAHSLGDSFNIEIGPNIKRISKVEGDLFALELDVKQFFANEKLKISNTIDLEAQELGNFGLSPEIIEELLDTTYMPLEYMEGIAFLRLFKFLQESNFDHIIFDTAPTGHTLKLLELPEYLDSFLGKIIRMQLRLSSFFNMFKKFLGFGDERDTAKNVLKLLESLRSDIRDIREIITDEKRTEFIIVTIPMEMSILESLRLAGELDAYKIPCRNMVVNMVRIYKGSCSFCRNLSNHHLRNLKEIIKYFYDKNIFLVPFFDKEIRGINSLLLVLQELKVLNNKYISELLNS